MSEPTERPKGYRFPKTIISYVVYLYHRFLPSYRDVQELKFKRGGDVSHETVRRHLSKFVPGLAEALRHRKPRRSRSWHHLEEAEQHAAFVTFLERRLTH